MFSNYFLNLKFFSLKYTQRFIDPCTFHKLLVENDSPEKIIADFKVLILHMDINTPNEINNKLADITKRVRKLYAAGRDD